MTGSRLAFVLGCVVAGCAVPPLIASRVQQPPETPTDVRYEAIAPGVQAARLFRSDALRDVIVDIRDVLVGPGKSAPEMPTEGFALTELKSGEVETTIDGQVAKRRPGDFWMVRPGQKYGVKSLGGLVVLHVVIFSKP